MNLKFISDAPQTSKGSIPWFVSFRIDISYGLDHFVVCRALRFLNVCDDVKVRNALRTSFLYMTIIYSYKAGRSK
jgi:hypothetical protein